MISNIRSNYAHTFAASHAKKRCLAAILSSTAVGLVMCAAPMTAQAGQAAAAPATEEIVVTGSRIVRDGFEAPTPLTVVGIEAIQTTAASNIADYVATMPVFYGGLSPSSTSTGITAGNSGVSQLNLRNLGVTRTLILLDGQRAVGSTFDNAVDINTFPQALVSRVDVVTGGASAVYGSDAVTGVVNFILDKEYTGTKGEISGGITSYGDGANYKATLTHGSPFANGRGHFLLSGEIVKKDEILNHNSREWATRGVTSIVNPLYSETAGVGNGQPRNLVLDKIGFVNAHPGGIITAGPLKGIAFGPGGTPYQFQYGTLLNETHMQGGAWRTTWTQPEVGNTLDIAESRQMGFARVAYDVTDNINVFAQAQWASSATFSRTLPFIYNGNLTIKADNAFIPASVRAQMPATLTGFAFGTINQDIPSIGSDNERIANRYVAGANGKFGLFDRDWTWNAYYQYGKVRNSLNSYNNLWSARYTQAIDAVVNPANGRIVCRSTLTSPTNGCQPYNVFGTGVNNQQTLNWLMGTAYIGFNNVQQVQEGTVTGSPFDNWAGPVSVALSVAHRTEKTGGINDDVSKINGWYSSNFNPVIGKYNVKEASGEIDFPLAKDVAWATSLDLNAAARVTDYSTSGTVVTWKVGASYSPIPDVRFRANRSRDIRAPTLTELFRPGAIGGQQTLQDPFTNTSVLAPFISTGNPNLNPEKADTTEVGVVLQPRFVPDLTFSADFWDINIKDAIGGIGSQLAINLCFQEGNYCDSIERTNGVITLLRTLSFNLAQAHTQGLDFEASYRKPVSDIFAGAGGDLSLHVNATHYVKDISQSPVSAARDGVGSLSGPPKWRMSANLRYNNEAFNAALTARYTTSGKLNNEHIECQAPNCPTNNAVNVTTNNNFLPAAFYIDVSTGYKLDIGDDVQTDLFFNVKNLFNTDPPLFPVGNYQQVGQTRPASFDVLGRVYRLGMRFRL